MKKVYYQEFVLMLSKMDIGDEFDFSTEYDSETQEGIDVFGVAKLRLFDSDVVVINYYGGGMPYIIDVTRSEYEIAHKNLERYFNDISQTGNGERYVYVSAKEVP